MGQVDFDRTPVIRTSSDVGFPIITPKGGPHNEEETVRRREDHRHSQGA